MTLRAATLLIFLLLFFWWPEMSLDWPLYKKRKQGLESEHTLYWDMCWDEAKSRATLKRGGEDRGGRTAENKWPLLLEPLRQLTMDSAMASRCLDIFVVWSLLPVLIYTNRIIKDMPGLQSNGKHSARFAFARCQRETGWMNFFRTTRFAVLVKYKHIVFLRVWEKVIVV